MYGFRDQRVLSWLEGQEVEQIGIGEHQVTFSFYPAGHMMVAGGWELLDPAGHVIDQAMEHANRGEYRLHRVIGSVVSKVVVESETAMVLSFANGLRLRLLDDDPRYEAVVMEPGEGQPTIVV
jgi:hypothetical protein